MREDLKRLRRQLLGLHRQAADMARAVERMLGAMPEEAPGPAVSEEHRAAIREIVTALNRTCGTRFSPDNQETAALIRDRLASGYTAEDFRRVIAVCWAAWGGEPKMRIYLRPSTLFGPRFVNYLQAARGEMPGRWNDGHMDGLEEAMIQRMQAR